MGRATTMKALFVGLCLIATLAARATASAATVHPPAPPPCANHLTVTRSDRTSAVYLGADPSDPAICLISINGTLTRSVWGSWTLRPFASWSVADVKDVVARIRSGPIGTKARISWPAGHKTNITTMERLPDETVNIGSQSYNCMVFRTTDNFSNEFMTWFDPKNRIPLRAKGTYPSTYDWQATAIVPSN